MGGYHLSLDMDSDTSMGTPYKTYLNKEPIGDNLPKELKALDISSDKEDFSGTEFVDGDAA